MAIARDLYVDGLDASPGTSLTWSHTCTGTDRGLIVEVFVQNASNTITGITYASVSMTLVDVQRKNANNEYCMLYRLANPASGANNVVVSASSSFFQARSVSYTGVHQTTMQDTSAKNTGAGVSTLSVTPTSTVDGCWAVTVARNDTGAVTDGTNYVGLHDASLEIGDSNGSLGTAGSKTITINGPSGGMCMVTCVIAPASGGGGGGSTPMRLTLMGVS